MYSPSLSGYHQSEEFVIRSSTAKSGLRPLTEKKNLNDFLMNFILNFQVCILLSQSRNSKQNLRCCKLHYNHKNYLIRV